MAVRDLCLSIFAVGLLALAAGPAARPAAAQEHPLDGLAATEFMAALDVLRGAGRLPEDARFPLIELLEPPKAEVLAWRPGDPVPRTVQAIVRSGGRTHEAVIDLGAKTLVSWTDAAGESMVLFEEFVGAMELALSHPDFVAGLKVRGLTPEEVFCLPLTAGNFFTAGEMQSRLMKVPCYVNPAGSNFYAKPIEGLFAVVDLNRGEVRQVVDTGAVPVPEDPWGYTAPELAERFGGLRPPARPVGLDAPQGGNVTIEGSRIAWDIWRFRYRIDKRPGLVLSLVEAKNPVSAYGGTGGPTEAAWRPVLYQAHLSEVFVPYMDPDEGWYWRTYMDSGEYGFGLFLSPLRPGTDCPAHAAFLPAVLHQDNGEPFETPNAVCIFERSIGDPAWRHFEIFAQSPETPVPAEGRLATELVVRTASEVGNYDYLLDYVFQQDGSIRIMVGSTGLDAVKGVAARSMADPSAAADTAWGSLIAPNLVAPNHDHFFNYRLDFDIDGRDNSFVRTALEPAPVAEGALRRSLWRPVHAVPRTEKEAQYRIDPSRPAMYHVMNHGRQSGLGHHPGYMIMPGNAVAYSPLDVANDPPAVRNAYIDKTFWVTPQDPAQRYAGGSYAFQSDGSDTLARWAEQDRPIVDTDIVVWATMGFHHLPRMEDWPVMPLMWKGMTLMPFNFFDHNPAITLPAPD